MENPNKKQCTITLTEMEVYNLNQFLKSSTITGKDAVVFAKLLEKINTQALRPEPTVKEDETDVK
jgi:hypothetical protein